MPGVLDPSVSEVTYFSLCFLTREARSRALFNLCQRPIFPHWARPWSDCWGLSIRVGRGHHGQREPRPSDGKRTEIAQITVSGSSYITRRWCADVRGVQPIGLGSKISEFFCCVELLTTLTPGRGTAPGTRVAFRFVGESSSVWSCVF